MLSNNHQISLENHCKSNFITKDQVWLINGFLNADELNVKLNSNLLTILSANSDFIRLLNQCEQNLKDEFISYIVRDIPLTVDCILFAEKCGLIALIIDKYLDKNTKFDTAAINFLKQNNAFLSIIEKNTEFKTKFFTKAAELLDYNEYLMDMAETLDGAIDYLDYLIQNDKLSSKDAIADLLNRNKLIKLLIKQKSSNWIKTFLTWLLEFVCEQLALVAARNFGLLDNISNDIMVSNTILNEVFFDAIEFGKCNFIASICSEIKSPYLINKIRNKDGLSVLSWAYKFKQTEAMKLLLEKIKTINIHDRSGKTLLEHCKENESLELNDLIFSFFKKQESLKENLPKVVNVKKHEIPNKLVELLTDNPSLVTVNVTDESFCILHSIDQAKNNTLIATYANQDRCRVTLKKANQEFFETFEIHSNGVKQKIATLSLKDKYQNKLKTILAMQFSDNYLILVTGNSSLLIHNIRTDITTVFDINDYFSLPKIVSTNSRDLQIKQINIIQNTQNEEIILITTQKSVFAIDKKYKRIKQLNYELKFEHQSISIKDIKLFTPNESDIIILDTAGNLALISDFFNGRVTTKILCKAGSEQCPNGIAEFAYYDKTIIACIPFTGNKTKDSKIIFLDYSNIEPEIIGIYQNTKDISLKNIATIRPRIIGVMAENRFLLIKQTEPNNRFICYTSSQHKYPDATVDSIILPGTNSIFVTKHSLENNNAMINIWCYKSRNNLFNMDLSVRTIFQNPHAYQVNSTNENNNACNIIITFARDKCDNLDTCICALMDLVRKCQTNYDADIECTFENNMLTISNLSKEQFDKAMELIDALRTDIVTIKNEKNI